MKAKIAITALITFAFLLVPLLLVVLGGQVMLRRGLFVLYTEEWRNSGSEGDAGGRRGRGITSFAEYKLQAFLGIKQLFYSNAVNS